MIDIHPPHETVHTWKDFFIHVATICVGLLIAIGLEQSVEWVHHRNEVRETRRALARERELNVVDSAARTREFNRITPKVKADLAVFLYLRAHPGVPPDQWPGKLSWVRLVIRHEDSAWQIALKNTVVYMPQEEVLDLTHLYNRLSASEETQAAFVSTLDEASSFAVREHDPSRLSPAEIDREIDLLSTALYQHMTDGNVLVNMAERMPGFSSPSRSEINAIGRAPSPPEDTKETEAILKETLNAEKKIENENKE